MSTGKGPLEGLRIVDLTRLAPGPFGTMLLGDLGADVVTVEPPRAQTASPFDEVAHFGAERARTQGLSPLFRSRRSIIVDLKAPAGRDVVLRLADRADVFCEGFRPGTCDRLGVGYDVVSERNPSVIYCSITGYGQRGALAQQAGHDLNYLAEAGLLAATTRGDAKPAIPVNAVADFAAGGLLAAFGILAALRGRDRTGTGTYIDASMYEGLLGLVQTVPAWTAVGAADPSWGQGLLSGACPFYDCYRTEDGAWLSVAALEPKFFRNLLTAIERSDLEPAYDHPERWGELREAFEAIFASAPLAHWIERFADVDTAIAPVRSLPDAFELGRDRGLVDGLCTVGPLPRMRSWDVEPGPVVARAGEHSREILAECGWAADEIDALIGEGVVDQSARA